MGKRNLTLWIVAVVIIVAVIVGIVIARSGKNDNSNNTPNTTSSQSSNNQSSNSDSSSAPQAVATDKVSIENMAFTPAAIKVKVGTTVTWTNNDSIAHTVTADSGDGPDSGNLDPGKSYSFTYKSAGTFSYHCEIHPDMTGTVQVTQ
jgi:plastocyanin